MLVIERQTVLAENLVGRHALEFLLIGQHVGPDHRVCLHFVAFGKRDHATEVAAVLELLIQNRLRFLEIQNRAALVLHKPVGRVTDHGLLVLSLTRLLHRPLVFDILLRLLKHFGADAVLFEQCLELRLL